jgi:uncharacterized protein (TIGR03083 family)
VQDQLSHLIGTESLLAGRAAPPDAPERPYVRNAIGAINEAWVESLRTRPGSEVLALFEALAADRAAALRVMTDEELRSEGPSPIGVVPYITFMDVRAMDCWVHEQDMRWALGRPGHLAGPVVDAALDRLGGAFAFVVGKRVAPSDGTSVVLDVMGPTSRHLTAVMADGRAEVQEPDGPPTASMSADLVTFVRVVTGRLAGADAVDQGLATVAGDAALGRAVWESLSIMP